LLTLLMFPLLVGVAWGQDKGWVFKKMEPESHFMGNVKVEPISLADQDDRERRPSLDMNKDTEAKTREEVEEAIRKMSENKEKKQGRLQ